MRFLLLTLLLLNGCAVCENMTQRCLNNTVQLCDTAGQWKVVMDCSTVQPTSKNWSCKEQGVIHTCLPQRGAK